MPGRHVFDGEHHKDNTARDGKSTHRDSHGVQQELPKKEEGQPYDGRCHGSEIDDF